ncbi:MAG: N-acetylmuramoyl-L-alanine amidase [Firmicutes bacterium]|nr:N-acetylmuramoyl-L-alanine amidase [Bacillota bacterium]
MNIVEKTYNWAYQPGKRGQTVYLILHHAAAPTATPDQIHSWHLARGWAGIAYHYYVRKDGSIYRGRPEDWCGAHTEGYNSCSIGVCFEGNFEEESMGYPQAAAGSELAADICARYPGLKVICHRDVNATACPGKNFPLDKIVYQEEEEIMDLEKFSALMGSYLAELSTQAPGDWSEEARQWAESEGLFVGDENGNKAYKRFMTREEFAVVAYRQGQKTGEEQA